MLIENRLELDLVLSSIVIKMFGWMAIPIGVEILLLNNITIDFQFKCFFGHKTVCSK